MVGIRVCNVINLIAIAIVDNEFRQSKELVVAIYGFICNSICYRNSNAVYRHSRSKLRGCIAIVFFRKERFTDTGQAV